MNLGSPDSTKVSDVAKYLSEFLMDEYVIDFPYIFRYLLVNGIITKVRAPKSAAAYKKVWTAEGSPLIVGTNQLKDAIKELTPYPVFAMMRYGNPSPQQVFDDITIKHPSVEEVIVLPLYPHWTMSSYETAVVYARKVFNKNNYGFKLRFISPFYNHPKYIQSLADSIRPHIENKDFDLILFSYHGIPERHIRKDAKRRGTSKASKDFVYPNIEYRDQCFETTRLTTAALGLAPDKTQTSFQSRLTSAGAEWIKPYTAPLLESLPKQQIKKIMVVCPAFINDCLETLEEIAMEGKEEFLDAGGESFEYIPCINNHPSFVKTVISWIH